MATTKPSNLKPLLLHAHSTGPNPVKVAIAFEVLKLPYSLKMWEFGDGPNGVKSEAFLKISENGRLPALEDPNTGVVSWESGAVINYILRKYDIENKLGPRKDTSEQERVDYEKWTLFLLTGVGPMTGQANWYAHYNEVKNEDAQKRFQGQTYRTYDVLEKQLGRSGGKSVLPTGFSAVDVRFYPWIMEWGYAELKIDGYPLIKEWLDRVGKMEEVKTAYAKIEEAAKAA